MRRLFAILGLLALAAPLPAAPTASTTLYDIEVLVFENSQPGLEGGEAWKEFRKELGDIEQAATPEGAPASDSALSQAAGALERGGQHRIPGAQTLAAKRRYQVGHHAIAIAKRQQRT